MKTWNKLRADWDLDDEVEGMVVLDPKKQVEEHEETEYEDPITHFNPGMPRLGER